jgi:opacity protein-like surface antigen
MFGYNWDQPSYGGVISAQVGDNIQVGRLVPGFSGGVETAGGAHQVWTAFAIGRLGYDLGRFLPYVGVGPAVTNFDHAGTGVSSAIGWTAVSGVSYRLDRNWSLTAEFSHDDFSPQAQSLAGSHRKSSDNGVRLGITFAFPSDR